jgi:hypothetical protein
MPEHVVGMVQRAGVVRRESDVWRGESAMEN